MGVILWAMKQKENGVLKEALPIPKLLHVDLTMLKYSFACMLKPGSCISVDSGHQNRQTHSMLWRLSDKKKGRERSDASLFWKLKLVAFDTYKRKIPLAGTHQMSSKQKGMIGTCNLRDLDVDSLKMPGIKEWQKVCCLICTWRYLVDYDEIKEAVLYGPWPDPALFMMFGR